MKKLGYRKSRTGCLQCKKRRVKCDELRPCSACVRHSVPCSLGGSPLDGDQQPSPESLLQVRSSSVSSSRASRKRRNSPCGFASSCEANSPATSSTSTSTPIGVPGQPADVTPQREDPFAYFSKLFTDMKFTKTSQWFSDMELMHHFTAVSYRTLTPDLVTQESLQYDVPRLALSNAYLLHQILAFAGYHLAYLVQENRHAYLIQASQHQNLAIDGLRTAISAPLTSENCHALYAASILLTVSAFSILPSYDRYQTSLNPLESIADIFFLIKGVSTIRDASNNDIKIGPLARMFNKERREQQFMARDTRLDLLQPQLESLESSLANVASDATSTVISAAISALSECISRFSSTMMVEDSVALRAAFLWPILLPTEYVALLRQRDPVAMVVLAYYCTILRLAESDCWVVNHWADALIECLWSGLSGGPYEEFILWPVENLRVNAV